MPKVIEDIQIQKIKMLYYLFADIHVVALACGVSINSARKYIQKIDDEVINIDFNLIQEEHEKALIYMLHRKGVRETGATTLKEAYRLVYGKRTVNLDQGDIKILNKIKYEISKY